MLNSKNIIDCDKKLQAVWKFANDEWNKKFSSSSVNPILTQTYRSVEIQNVYYLQGRSTLAILNLKRKELGLYAISEKENKIITYLKGGKSKHNMQPSKAFDIAFITSDTKKVIWTEKYFFEFAKIVKSKFEKEITWGGDFKSFKDLPHFELK